VFSDDSDIRQLVVRIAARGDHILFSWFLLPFYEAGKAYGKVLGGSENEHNQQCKALIISILEKYETVSYFPWGSVGGCVTNGYYGAARQRARRRIFAIECGARNLFRVAPKSFKRNAR
jgi:hypothetical protein